MPQSAIPSLDSFISLAETGAAIPVYRTLLADHLTPVSAYERVAAGSTHSFLLESVVGGERIGRYSIIGTHPRTVIHARGNTVTLHSAGASAKTYQSADPLKDLESLMQNSKGVRVPGLPSLFGGAVGYAGYDTVRYLEPEKLNKSPHDDRGLPDMIFGLYDDLVIFDHVQKTILVVATMHVTADSGDNRKLYDAALNRIDATVKKLQSPLPTSLSAIDLTSEARPKYDSNFTKADFEKAVLSAKEYIKAGDIFQLVLSQRLRTRTAAHPLDVYRRLRVVNPSPYMFFMVAPECTLVGSSPEIMCRVENGIITNRPLAGTRRRGVTPEEDKALEQELLADPKERAEHIMLVDLGRNDVGRVAEIGSVKISDVMTVERYSHVMHIVSNVTGKLEHGRSAFDALRMALPVGTVSGAPKIRAMQIIDELEPTRRGPYAGAVGYVDYNGNMDTAIALRTMVIVPDGNEWVVYVQAGAGLVADSVPENEYQETLNKAAGLLKAVALADQARNV